MTSKEWSVIRSRVGFGAAVVFVACMFHAGAASAQLSAFFAKQGNAVNDMILLGIEQSIGNLPPPTSQARVYEFDPTLDAFRRSDRVGPSAFRSPETLGDGVVSLSLDASYLGLERDFKPILYDVTTVGSRGTVNGATKFGLDASADVGLFNLAFSYGALRDLDISISLPIVIVDVAASPVFVVGKDCQMFKTCNVPRANLDTPLNDPVPGSGAKSLESDLSNGVRRFNAPGFANVEGGAVVSEGTQAGLGRSAVGAKYAISIASPVRLAFAADVLLPSPNQDEYAGTNTFAILPRLISAYNVSGGSFIRGDVGYQYDFDIATLRRFAWNAAFSQSWARWSIDLGFGGSLYDQAIRWTPQNAYLQGRNDDGPAEAVISTSANTSIGRNLVDFIGGFKARLNDAWFVAGTVNVPVTQDGFRPAAAGTLSIEWIYG